MRTVMIRRFKIPCSKDSLKAIRAFVLETLENIAVPDMESNMLVLAVDEICANRIIHSNEGNESLFLEIIIKKEEGSSIIFEIIDAGAPFDPTDYIEPSLVKLIQDKKKGGIGLMLVNRIMDSLEVSTVGNLTVFKMLKKLPLAS